jgi:hypothetical protein
MADPLEWCLLQLLGEPDNPASYEREMLFDFLDSYLAGALREEKLRLDELVFDKYTDFASLNEMRLMVHLCRPRFKERNVKEVQENEASQGWKYINRGLLEKSTAYDQLVDQTKSFANVLNAVYLLPQPYGKDQQYIVRDD